MNESKKMLIRYQVDNKGYKSKEEAKDEYGRRALRMGKGSFTVGNFDTLKKAIEEGKSFRPGCLTGTDAETWRSQQIIAFDVDNDVKPEKMLDIYKAWDIFLAKNLPPRMIYKTFNYTEERPKFRILFLLDQEITDREKMKSYINKLLNVLEENFAYEEDGKIKSPVDMACQDFAKIYLGTNQEIDPYDDNPQILSIKDLEALEAPETIRTRHEEKKDEEKEKRGKQKKEEPARRRAAGVSKSPLVEIYTKTDEAAENEDIIEFTLNHYGGEVKKGSQIFVNPCPICGANDSYKCLKDEKNIYHCFSDKHPKETNTGDVIKLIMSREGLSKDSARDKYRCEYANICTREELKEARDQNEKTKAAAEKRKLEASKAKSQTVATLKPSESIPPADPEAKKDTPEEKTGADQTEETKKPEEVGAEQTEEAKNPEETETTEAQEPRFKDVLKGSESGLDSFIQDLKTERYKPIETGVKFIDTLLSGGFIRGTLVTMGAAPGMGKTALTQFIFESIAAKGSTALYINLEMSRDQLIARSLSKHAYKINNYFNLDALKILQGYKWKPEEEVIIKQALTEYRKKTGGRLIYNPEGINNQLSVILELIEEVCSDCTKEGKEAPIICIDYLQIITNDFIKDPTEGVKDAIYRFKEIALRYNTTVFVILANNRDSNKRGEASLESGRDTSALEYSADINIGLTYTAIFKRWKVTAKENEVAEKIKANSRDKSSRLIDINIEIMRQLKRDFLEGVPENKQQYRITGETWKEPWKYITLIVNKSRFALDGRCCHLCFDAAHSDFKEIDLFTEVPEVDGFEPVTDIEQKLMKFLD